MKKLILFLSCITVSLTLQAQLPRTSPLLKAHHQLVNKLMQPQMQAAGQKSVLSERVKAQSTWDNYMGSKSDSVYLSYVLNGTSTYDYNMMLYPYNYPYSTSPMFDFLGVFTKPQVHYSRYDHWTVNPNTLVYGFYQRSKAEYDANFNLIRDTALYADSAIFPNMRYVNGFNAADNLDSCHSWRFSSSVSTNAFKQFFSYNASDKLIKDSIYEYDSGNWYLVAKTLYTYDVPGNLVQIDNYVNTTDTTFSMPLIEQMKYVNTYDASGRLKTVETSIFDGTLLKPYVRDTFAYSGVIPFHLSWKEYQYDAINFYWAPMTFMTKTLGGTGLPDVVNINTFDSLANAWIPYYRWNISYNASNDPLKLEEYIYNFTAFPSTPDFTTRYYYETFTSTTGISEQNSSKPWIYPNPATSRIIVKGLDKNEMNVTIFFTDALGRLVSRESAFMTNGELKLSTEHLDSGTYILSVTGMSGRSLVNTQVMILR